MNISVLGLQVEMQRHHCKDVKSFSKFEVTKEDLHMWSDKTQVQSARGDTGQRSLSGTNHYPGHLRMGMPNWPDS